MNMYGIMTPAGLDEAAARPDRLGRLKRWLWRRRLFLLIVVLPTFLIAAYLYLVASDQYESEAHFLVRSQRMAESATPALSQGLGMITGASTAYGEAMGVADYLTSHDAVNTLRQQDALVQRFQRPGVDLLSRLHGAKPTPERLLKYYRSHVLVDFNMETGITTVRVHGFRPDDAYVLLQKLLMLGEQRVNYLNARSYNDALAMARRQLADAENALAQGQSRLTRYRQSRGDVNPTASGQAQIGVVATLNEQLAAARAQLNAMGNLIGRSSPQYQALATRVRALEAQVAGQAGKLTGGSQTIAASLGGYEELQLRQQFLSQRYQSAANALERAREQALRQQLYVVRVVEPNMPVKSLYPERGRILLTVLIALFLAYSIGWLIVAGVREHAA